jgi:hypothetical protein
LTKIGLRQGNKDAHAVIYMDGDNPTLLKGEETPAKRNMIVRPENTSDRLHPASRVSFERAYAIEYNEPVIVMGHIRQDCMPYLRAYFAGEVNKPRESRPDRRRDSTRDRKTEEPARKRDSQKLHENDDRKGKNPVERDDSEEEQDRRRDPDKDRKKHHRR